MTKALTLRLPDEMHESLRREAFERRMPITTIIQDAIEHRRINGSLGCDVCGNPKVAHVSTPGGFRFCADHWHPRSADPSPCCAACDRFGDDGDPTARGCGLPKCPCHEPGDPS